MKTVFKLTTVILFLLSTNLIFAGSDNTDTLSYDVPNGSVKIYYHSFQNDLVIYPSHVSDQLNIDWGNTSFPYNYEIINLIGQSVSKGIISNSGEKQITVSNLEEGIYILKMQSGDIVQTKKFVKKE